MRIPRTPLILTSVFLTAVVSSRPCGAEAGPSPAAGEGWYALSEEIARYEASDQLKVAVAARDELGSLLMGRLMQAIAEKGPAAAVSVCRSEAPEIARQVSRERGVSIGRTSFKLRNPGNTPPEWALEPLTSKPTTPSLLRGPSGELGALFPIRLKAQCLTCHGSPETIPQDVTAKLESHYPNDKAVGFREGDLRGWFWVEVPR